MSAVFNFLNMSEEEGRSANDLYREKTSRRFTGTPIFNVSKIKTGKSATMRFIAADPEGKVYPEFCVIKKVIPLQFVDPENDGQFIRVNAPVREMYESGPGAPKCPLVERVRPLYKEADAMRKKGREEDAKVLTKLANQHWIDPEYICQGFILNPGCDDDIPSNVIYRTYLRKTIYRQIDLGMTAEDAEQRLQYWPCHPRLGFNFIIRKTVKQAPDGPQNDYSQSGWARSPSPLTDDQIAVLEKGFPDLTQALPPRPNEEEYEFLGKLMDFSLNGKNTWDPSWESQLTTVKPIRVDSKGKLVREQQEESAETASLSERVRQRLGEDNHGESGEAIMSKLGTTADIDSPVEETANAESAEKSKDGAAPSPSDIASRIRNRLNKKP